MHRSTFPTNRLNSHHSHTNENRESIPKLSHQLVHPQSNPTGFWRHKHNITRIAGNVKQFVVPTHRRTNGAQQPLKTFRHPLVKAMSNQKVCKHLLEGLDVRGRISGMLSPEVLPCFFDTCSQRIFIPSALNRNIELALDLDINRQEHIYQA